MAFGINQILMNEFFGDVLDLNFINAITDELKYKTKSSKRTQASLGHVQIMLKEYMLSDFKQHFRMNRTTFQILLKEVALEREQTKDIDLESQLLFTLWILGNQESLEVVANRFSIEKKWGQFVFEQCIQILSKLMPKYVKWQTEEEQALTADIFEFKSRGIVGVTGVIDCCHIPIRRPLENSFDYYNVMNYHSVILQGVCDSAGKFMDVFIGMPGSINDATVFRNSPLCMKKDRRLVGDVAYPLSTNLLTPYAKKDVTQFKAAHEIYNKRLNVLHSIIVRALGLLVSRFRRLQYLDVKTPKAANYIISACCMLHNFIQINEDTAEEDDIDEEAVSKIFMPPNNFVDNQICAEDAYEQRNFIKNRLNQSV
ncbi:putative nuclease HARBI1 isoform X2 [Scaptodrosophila lebanonensis]|nr:putative nuclease HARBI1 isoform X2 [Scaptodrosophila lebanonensis]